MLSSLTALATPPKQSNKAAHKVFTIPPIGHSATIVRSNGNVENIHGEEKMYFDGPPEQTDYHYDVLYVRDPVSHQAYLGAKPTMLVSLTRGIVGIGSLDTGFLTYHLGNNLPTVLQANRPPAAVWKILDKDIKLARSIANDRRTIFFPDGLLEKLYALTNDKLGYLIKVIKVEGDTFTLTLDIQVDPKLQELSMAVLEIDASTDSWKIIKALVKGVEIDLK